MRAILSGQAGIAMFGDGDDVWSITVEEPEERIPRAWSDAWYLFADATDVVEVADVSDREAVQQLERAWRQDRALQLLLVLLDGDEESETRVMAAECVEAHFEFPEIRQFVACRLYAASLPPSADVPGAMRQVARAEAELLREFLDRLAASQPAIAQVRQAWDDLPADLFGDDEAKLDFESVAVTAGTFQRLVEGRLADRIDAECMALLKDGRLKTLPHYRRIMTNWIQPLRSRRATPAMERPEDTPGARRRKGRQKQPHQGETVAEKPQTPHEAWTRAEKEIDAVLSLFDRGREPQAVKYAEELVQRQTQSGDVEFAAKTLCNLAKHMKDRSRYRLQLHFAERAVQVSPADRQSLDQLADAHLCNGEIEKALQHYEKTIERFPNNVVAQCGRGEVLREMGDLDRALRQFEETIERFPNNVVAHCGRGEVLREMGDLDRALRQFEETIERFPNNVVAQCGRGEVLREMGDLDRALRQFEETIERFPNDVVARNGHGEVLREMGDLDRALRQFEETIERFPNNVVAQCGRGEVLREMGDLDRALRYFEETIERFPNNVVAQCGRGEVLREMGDLDRALRQFEETIERFPNDVFAHCGRGEVLREMGDLDRALRQFEETIERFPNNVVARNGRGEVLREMGDLDRALRQFEETIERFPNDVFAHCGRGEVLREMGDLDRALRQFEETIERFPNNVVAQCGRGEVLREMGDLDRALRQFEQTIERFPNNVVARNGRGEVLREMGDLDRALRQFEETIERFPNDSVARSSRVNVLVGMERFAEALELLPTHLPRTRHDWIDLHLRGMIHLRRGQVDMAIEIFRQGTDRCPFAISVGYFRRALAAAQLRAGQYGEAERTLEGQADDVAEVLRLHAQGEQGKTEEARASHQRLLASRERRVVELRDELAAVFVSDRTQATTPSSQWRQRVLDQELELVTIRLAA